MHIHVDLGYHPAVSKAVLLKVKVQIGCRGMMGLNLVDPYIQSTTVLCDMWLHTRKIQCIVGSLYVVYTAASLQCQNMCKIMCVNAKKLEIAVWHCP